jgi:hypothetical protein
VPDVRYSIPGVPPDPARGITAFAPAFVRHAASGAQSYKYAVTGRPGTRGIRVDAREDNIESHYTGQAMMGTARSSDAPDAIYPNQYFQRFVAEPPGPQPPQQPRVYDPQRPGRTTLLPVPAEDGRAAYQALSARLSNPNAATRRPGQVPWFPRFYSPEAGG